MYCTKCGTEINKDINYCPNCGEKIINSEKTNNLSDIQEDLLFATAGKIVVEKQKGSIGLLQRELKIGFNNAARIMERLEKEKVVGSENGTSPRAVMMSANEYSDYIKSHYPNIQIQINPQILNSYSPTDNSYSISAKECCAISCFSTMLILGINFIAFAIGGKTEDTYTAALTPIWYAFIFIASFVFTGYVDTKKKNTNFKVNKKSMWISISVTAIVGVLGNCFLLDTIGTALDENKALNKLLIYGFIFIILGLVMLLYQTIEHKKNNILTLFTMLIAEISCTGSFILTLFDSTTINLGILYILFPLVVCSVAGNIYHIAK